ncbi:hypothetical protein [Actinocatenispora comari]|nr:hypothetical protein [Actinocatenispora comari]
MGKKRRLKSTDRRSRRHIKVFDAAQVITMAEQMILQRANPAVPPVNRQAAAVAENIYGVWRKTQVVLRVDREFVNALLASDTDAKVPPDWLDQQPFDSLVVSLSEPLSLHDGHDLCHYVGFIVCGTRVRGSSTPSEGQIQNVWTTYGPFAKADGIRFLWLYTAEGDPTTRCQTLSCMFRGEFSSPDRTITDLVEAQQGLAEQLGHPWGPELSTLTPLSLQLLLYLTAQRPDLDWLPDNQVSRPTQLTGVRLANVGWRVGENLRSWRRDAPPASREAGSGASRPHAAVRALPPHIRRAHWHRVRVATRGDDGQIVGSTTGTYGVDWSYQMRWYPPTPVNVDSALSPVVRGVDPEKPSG